MKNKIRLLILIIFLINVICISIVERTKGPSQDQGSLPLTLYRCMASPSSELAPSHPAWNASGVILHLFAKDCIFLCVSDVSPRHSLGNLGNV